MNLDGDGLRKSRLGLFQLRSIDLFIHLAATLSLPRSFGEIYGLLMATEGPLSLDDVVALLGISRGSASQGLRWLRDAGAIKSVYIQGIRKEHFTAEMELRRLAAGMLRERVEPHLESGHEWLRSLSEAAARSPNGFEAERVEKLRRWHSVVEKALPILKTLFAAI
jgi:DNA-binding transcriptional regulator GbsR (MarR family)